MSSYRSTRAIPLRLATAALLLSIVSLPARAGTLLLHPGTPLLTPGTRLALGVDAFDDAGGAIPAAPLTFAVTSGASVASVTPDGVLSGLAPGTFTVTVGSPIGSLAAQGYVVTPDAALRISAPAVEAASGGIVFVPLILSSSPLFLSASATVRLTSDDPTAPPLPITSILPADGATVTAQTPVGQGLQFTESWTTPVRGPLVAANARIDLPAGYVRDTVYRVEITQASVMSAAGSGVAAAASDGGLRVRTSTPGALVRLNVNPGASTVQAGQSVQLEADGVDAAGNTVPNLAATWSVDPASAGSVNSLGLFLAKAPGAATVTAATAAGLSGAATVTVVSGSGPPPEWLVLPDVSAKGGAIADLPLLLGPLKGLAGLSCVLHVTGPAGAPTPLFLDPDTGPIAVGTLLSANLNADGSQTLALLSPRDLAGPGLLLDLHLAIPAAAPGGTRYSVSVDQLDMSDGGGQSIPGQATPGAIDVVADTSAPTASLSGFAMGAFVSGSVTPTVTAVDDVGVARVDLVVDGATVASSTVEPYLLTWDTTVTPDGNHQVRARAVDSSGNAGLSESFLVVVDNTKPLAALTAPGPGAGLHGKVTVTGSAFDANFAGYRLQAAPSDAPDRATDVSAPAATPVNAAALGVWDTTTMPDGRYILRLVVRDRANNVSEASVPVLVANAAPAVRFASPPPGPVRGTVPLTVQPSGGAAPATVDFTVDGAPPVRVAAAPFTLALDTTALSDGVHTIHATATNVAGVTGDAALLLVVDNTPPALLVSSPVAQSSVHGLVTLRFTVHDASKSVVRADAAASGSPGAYAPIGSSPVDAGDGSGSIPWDAGGLAEGSYLLRIVATDDAGNVAQQIVPVTVDNTPPDLLIRLPAADAWAGTSLTVDAAAADAGGIASLAASVDGTEVARTATVELQQAIDLSGIPEGMHALLFTATDRAGNVRTASVTLHVDRTPPVAQIQSPRSPSRVSGDVTVAGTVTDAPPGQIAEFALDIGSGAAPTAWQTVASGTGPRHSEALGTFGVAGLPAGLYTLRLTATDRAGNEARDTATITVGGARLPGDINGDGKVDLKDATLALEAAVGLVTLTPDQAAAGDVNHDGQVNVSDATRIMFIAVGLG